MTERVTIPMLAERIAVTNKRLDKIEDNVRWLLRLAVATLFTVIGAVIIAMVTKNL